MYNNSYSVEEFLKVIEILCWPNFSMAFELVVFEKQSASNQLVSIGGHERVSVMR